MSVYEKMTAIADAIRGKTGGTALLTLDEMAAAIAGIEAGGGGESGGGLPEGMNAFILTMTEDYPSRTGGWTMTIPHGLGKTPSFAVVMRTTGITVASHLRGWIGTDVHNLRMTNKVGINNEELSMQDNAAAWIRADETNLYCTSGSWGGSLLTGVTLLVGVLE